MKPRVLAIDDEPLLLNALSRALGRELDFVGLSDAREALARLLDGDDYDVILCDVMMRELSGVDLHRALLERAPELAARMVFLTGGVLDPQIERFLDGLPNTVVRKPFSLAHVRDVVRRLVDGASRRARS